MEEVSGTPYLKVSIDGDLRTMINATAFNVSRNLAPSIVCDVEDKVGGVVNFGSNCEGILANPVIFFVNPWDLMISSRIVINATSVSTQSLVEMKNFVPDTKVCS